MGHVPLLFSIFLKVIGHSVIVIQENTWKLVDFSPLITNEINLPLSQETYFETSLFKLPKILFKISSFLIIFLGAREAINQHVDKKLIPG